MTTSSLSPHEQYRLCLWMMEHRRALHEDMMPTRYRYRVPHSGPLPPWAWVVLHVVGGLVMGIVVARR